MPAGRLSYYNRGAGRVSVRWRVGYPNSELGRFLERRRRRYYLNRIAGPSGHYRYYGYRRPYYYRGTYRGRVVPRYGY